MYRFSLKVEVTLDDTAIEEMLRILLKQIIIKCTRIWKQEHQMASEEAKPKMESYNLFSKDRFLTKNLMMWMWDNYTTDANQRKEMLLLCKQRWSN